MIQAVVFDIGNVLIEWNPERYYDRAIGQKRRREMFDAVDLHAINEKVDAGAHFTETMYAAADDYPQFGAEIRMWHDNWLEMASPGIDHSVRLLRALRAKKVPVFALSNFGIQTFDLAVAAYPFLNEFDRAYISGHLGMIKPNAGIYEVLENDSGVAPSALLFTDDREENIAAADGRGWRTHLFRQPGGWAETLVQHGLLTPAEAT